MNRLHSILFIFWLLVVAVFVLQTCKDSSSAVEEVEETPAMSISAEAPESVDFGEVYSLEIAGENTDGPVDLQYTISRTGVEDSSVTRSITPTAGQFTDSFSVPAQIAGDHNIVYSAADSDDEVNGSRTIVVNAPDDSTMAVTVDAPTTVQSNGPYTVTFTGSAADGPVNGEYSLSRPGVADSTVSRSLEPTDGAFTDVFSVNSGIVGQHELSYSFSDGDDEITGTASITVALPDDNISSIDIQGPQGDLYTNMQLDFRFLGEDQDGIDTAIIREEFNGVADSTTYETIDANTFDQMISRTFSQPGTYQASLEIIDAFGRSIRGEQTFEIVNEPDSPASITLTTPSGRGAQTWSLSATDADGWAQAELIYEMNGVQHTIPVDISGSMLTATTTSPEEPGNYQITLDATDNLGNDYSESSIAQILAVLTERQITVETSFEGIDAEIQFGFNGQNPSGVTDANGSWSTTVTAPSDSLVEFSAGADAVGLVGTNRQESSLADTTIQLTPDIVPITFSGAFEELRPRSEKTVDLRGFAQAIDDGESIITQLTLEYSGVNLLVEPIEGSTYRIATSDEEDPAGVTESLTLLASHPFTQAQQAYDQRIKERASIEFLQTSFEGVEREELVLDLQDILSSQATITQASITNSSTGLSAGQIGDWQWNLITTENISSNQTYSFDIEAENAEGNRQTMTATYNVNALPEFSATVHDNVTDDILPNVYAITEDFEDGQWVQSDTLQSPNGVFDAIEISAEYIRFGYVENARKNAFEHRIRPEANASYQVPIAPWIKRDSFGNRIGMWTEDEMTRRYEDMRRTWAFSTYGTVNQEGSTGNFNGTIANWNNPLGQPKKVLLIKNLEIQFRQSDGTIVSEFDSMRVRDIDLVTNWYENETRQVNDVGNPKITQAPEMTVVEEYTFKVWDREDGNMYIWPRSEIGDRPAVVITSTGNGKIYDAFIYLRSGSPIDPGERGQYFDFTQESVAIIGEKGTRPAQDLGTMESMVNNNVNTRDAQWFPLNRFASWITNHTGYMDMPNETLFDNAVILPGSE